MALRCKARVVARKQEKKFCLYSLEMFFIICSLCNKIIPAVVHLCLCQIQNLCLWLQTSSEIFMAPLT